MGPSRHTRAAAAASAGASSSRNDESASSSPSKTPVRSTPYARTPTKPASSSALTLDPSTPTSRTSSPMMLREIFSMISPFRGLSRARRSAAFGAADEDDTDQDISTAAVDQHLGQSPKLENVQETVDADDADDRMIEDVEQGIAVADTSLVAGCTAKITTLGRQLARHTWSSSSIRECSIQRSSVDT
ncbi:hypothetical protein [Sporisorium scitamineum]|uniref:Uncharacterized protein n=1 Tax=Sporisorium scitamineum TaxID=49012 RepID=A0A0F7RTN6_9BASI|nr:hypothetical protein [Sporisorium scitamineum]